MRILILALLVYVSGCDKKEHSDKRKGKDEEKAIEQVDGGTKETPKSPEDERALVPGSTIQLKSSDMIAQSIFATLGRGKTLRSEGQTTVDVTEEFKKNFGGTSGLRLGEIYADAPSTSYLLALTIVAELAARRCMEEIGAGSGELCQCSTKEQADAMLSRALPHLNFSAAYLNAISEHFASSCAENPEGAITSLIGSLAFATRI